MKTIKKHTQPSSQMKVIISSKKRRYLTLVEVLLVLLILALTITVIGINLGKAVHEQRFRAEVDRVVDTLKAAQYIMLILDNDVHVKLQREEHGIRLHLETRCPLSGNWGKLLEDSHLLTSIRVVNFNDLLKTSPAEPGVADIRFLSQGYAMSQGVLRLATTRERGETGSLESFVCLPGYPSFLKSVQAKPDLSACSDTLDEAFVDHMTSLIVDEIHLLQEKRKSNGKKEDSPQ